MKHFHVLVATAFIGLFSRPATAKDLSSIPPFYGRICEVHVWVFGRPNFQPRSSMLIKVTPQSAEDLANPYSTTNVFSSLQRTETLSDTQLTSLFPGASSVKVIHHSDLIDLDKSPIGAIKAPLAPHQTDCYADIGIANVYAIFPNSNAPYVLFGIAGGLLGSALTGSDRLVIDFWLQQWSNNVGQKPFVMRRRKDTPLPHVQPGTPAFSEAARASADLNLADFVVTANDRRKPQH